VTCGSHAPVRRLRQKPVCLQDLITGHSPDRVADQRAKPINVFRKTFAVRNSAGFSFEGAGSHRVCRLPGRFPAFVSRPVADRL
jgi:hypothetical protein